LQGWSSPDEELLKALAKLTAQRIEELKHRGVANTAWAFARMGQQYPGCTSEFYHQGFANTVWALATMV